MKFVVCTFGVLFGANAIAGSCTQTNNKLGLVGLDDTNGRVFASLSNHNNKCECNHVRFYPDNADTDKALSILLIAKTTSKNVRVDFSTQGDCDSGWRVYLQ